LLLGPEDPSQLLGMMDGELPVRIRGLSVVPCVAVDQLEIRRVVLNVAHSWHLALDLYGELHRNGVIQRDLFAIRLRGELDFRGAGGRGLDREHAESEPCREKSDRSHQSFSSLWFPRWVLSLL